MKAKVKKRIIKILVIIVVALTFLGMVLGEMFM
jgi:cytochrome c-type biogenesis protein CcmE